MMRFLALVLGLLCVSTGAGLADGNTGRVYGRVLVNIGQGRIRPSCGVIVRVESDRQPTIQTRTRPDGSFLFASVFPGSATIVVGDMKLASQSVEISANLPSITPNFVVDDLIVDIGNIPERTNEERRQIALCPRSSSDQLF
jgi:hypothetical protein